MKDVQLRIAIWSCDTRFDHTLFKTDMNLGARVEALTSALLKAREWLDAPTDRHDIETLKVFIAPENVLIDSRQVESSSKKANAISFEDFKVYCHEDKLNKLCTGILPELSKGILLIPGTVLLKKPLKAQEEELQEALKLDKLDARMRASLRVMRPSTPKHMVEDYIRPGMAKLKNKVKHIQEKTQSLLPDQRDIQIVRNVALVFFDGELLFKYKKREEYKSGKQTGEFSPGDKKEHTAIKFFPGHKDGVFPLKLGGTSITCGIEICMDHNVGALRYTESAKNLHLHFIVSDHVTNKPQHSAVKEGGYVVHASTDVDMVGVFDHSFNRAGTRLSVKLDHGSLTFHQQVLKLPS